MAFVCLETLTTALANSGLRWPKRVLDVLIDAVDPAAARFRHRARNLQPVLQPFELQRVSLQVVRKCIQRLRRLL